MQKRYTFGIIAILLIIGGAWYLIKNKTKIIEPTTKNITVTISDRGLASALPIYIAVEKGYFEKYNVTPKLIKFTTGNDVLNALITNQIDVGEMPIDPLIFAEDKGNTNIKIALTGRWSETDNKNFDALYVKKDSQIKSLTNLTNKKIGVFPGITAKIFFAQYLDQNKIDSKKVELVELAPNVQIQSLASGSIDALFAYQPTVTIADKNTDLVKIDESIYNKIDVDLFAIYGFSNYFSKNDIAKQTQKALLEAIQYMQSNENESKNILSKYTTLGDLSTRMTYFPQYHQPTGEDIRGLKEYFDFYQSKNLTKNTFTEEKVKSLIFFP